MCENVQHPASQMYVDASTIFNVVYNNSGNVVKIARIAVSTSEPMAILSRFIHHTGGFVIKQIAPRNRSHQRFLVTGKLFL